MEGGICLHLGVGWVYNNSLNQKGMQAMKTKLPIYAICFVTLIYLVPSVAVSGLVTAFPGVPEDRLLFLLTIPNLMGIVGTLGVPMLTPYFSRKHLSLVALSLFFLGGGVSFCFHDHLGVLLVGSAIMGVAYGMSSTLYPLLVSMYYEGEERSRVMGVASGMLQLGRIAVVLLGGVLADLRWYDVYLLFGVTLIPLLLTALWLPGDKPPLRVAREQSHGISRGWNLPELARLSAIGFAFAICYYVNVTHSSLYIEGYGLGSAVMTGVVTAVASVLSGVLAICFGPIYRRTGVHTFTVALAVTGVGYVLAGVSTSLWAAVLAVCGSAVGMALFSPCLMLELTEAAPQDTLPAATALVLTILNVGYFLSPTLVGAVAQLRPGAGAAGQFLAGGVLSLAATLGCILLERKRAVKRAI